MIETPWDHTVGPEAAYKALFASVPEGLTYLSLHFNTRGDFEAVEPDKAHIRTEEYEFFRPGVVPALLAEHAIEVISMRELRDRRRPEPQPQT